VPVYLALFFLVTLLAPLLAIIALAVDVVRRVVARRPFMAVRILAFGWLYLAVGVACLAALLIQWAVSGFGASRTILLEGSYRLQAWWAATLFGAVRRLFRLTVDVEGLDVVRPGPVIVLMRHASIIDTLLPNVLITREAGVRLRYVLKRELLGDPALDIAGNRLINHFVDRGGDSSSEVAAVVALAEGMTEAEGVLIYPEGTRFTEERLRRIVEKAGRGGDGLSARAGRFRRVLPPRPGGTSALLGTGHDVVVVAHTGLEPLATIPDAWSGRIIGSSVRVRFWRFPAAGIPDDRRGRIGWLFDRWEEVDEWIAG
jgi:1-acyl-sn-glycerol-3-phosphate acyltransferase